MDNVAANASDKPVGKPIYKRRQFLIKKGLQFKFAMVMFYVFGLAAFMVWWETYQSFSGLTKSGLISDPVVMAWIRQISKVILAKIAISTVLVFVLSILLSHYLAGPIYRLERCLELFRDLNFSIPMRLRRGDQLKDVERIYNETRDAVCQAVENERERISGLADRLAALENKLDKRPANELNKILAELRRVLHTFKTR
jgi:methyl-accepting chemotaxis protein